MAVTQELIFASQAHADAAVAVIDAAKGLTGGETWDVPKAIGTYYRIAKPDDGSDSGVANIVATQTLGYAKIVYIENEGGTDDDGQPSDGGLLENEDGEFLQNEPIILE